MRYLDLTLPEPAANLAVDEALLLDVDAGSEEVPARLGMAGARGCPGLRLPVQRRRPGRPVPRRGRTDPPALQRRRHRPVGAWLFALQPGPGHGARIRG